MASLSYLPLLCKMQVNCINSSVTSYCTLMFQRHIFTYVRVMTPLQPGQAPRPVHAPPTLAVSQKMPSSVCQDDVTHLHLTTLDQSQTESSSFFVFSERGQNESSARGSIKHARRNHSVMCHMVSEHSAATKMIDPKMLQEDTIQSPDAMLLCNYVVD